jgi:hypothetical protein
VKQSKPGCGRNRAFFILGLVGRQAAAKMPYNSGISHAERRRAAGASTDRRLIVLNRICPSCFAESVPVKELLVSYARCPNCRAAVGPHWLFNWPLNLLTFLVTSLSTIAVLAQFGIYAALLWFPFPVGALGYLKASFSPLEVKDVRPRFPARSSRG